jgi:hypothetical protein
MSVVARLSAPVQTGSVALSALFTMGTRSLSGGKAAAGWPLPTFSSAEVQERVELYLKSPFAP